MSSCTECHGMAGEKYDDHSTAHCPRLRKVPKTHPEVNKTPDNVAISDGDVNKIPKEEDR